jgi:hypothetical protein
MAVAKFDAGSGDCRGFRAVSSHENRGSKIVGGSAN